MNIQKNFAVVVAIILAVLVLGGVIYIAQTKKDEAPISYSSQVECEQKTSKRCDFMMCDVVPPGKTFEEVCGKNFKSGWQPINEPLQPPSSVSSIPTTPSSYHSEAECESKTGRWCWQELRDSATIWQSSDQKILPLIKYIGGEVPEDWRRYANGPRKISFSVPRTWENKVDFENSTDLRLSFASSTNPVFPDPSSRMLFMMSQGNFISLENYKEINDNCEFFPEELRLSCTNNIVSIGTAKGERALVMQRPKLCSPSGQSGTGQSGSISSGGGCSENYVGVVRLGGKYLFLWTQDGIANFASSTLLLLDIAGSLHME